MITEYNDCSKTIEKYWQNIEEIVKAKDENKLTELRLNVTLLRDYIYRQKVLRGDITQPKGDELNGL